MANYDPNNIFAKILRGELPTYKVFEDDKVFAFLDIMPRAPGHTLVIPKNPARTIIDVTPDDLTHVMKATQKIARAALKAFAADGITIQQFNERAGGQVVFHLHVHVLPRHEGVALLPPASRKEDAKVLEENAAKLAAVGLDVEQRGVVEAIEPTHQHGVALDGDEFHDRGRDRIRPHRRAQRERATGRFVVLRALQHEIAARPVQPVDHLEVGIEIDALD